MEPKEPTFDRRGDSVDPSEEMAESPALARRRQLLGVQPASGDFTAYGGDEPRQQTLLPDLEATAPEPDPEIPPLPDGTAPRSIATPRGMPEAARPRLGRRLRYVVGIAAVIAVALGWWLLPRGNEAGSGGEAPLVVAEQGPEKIRPQEEGGMQVPNQGMSIYNELGGTQTASKPEVLLPGPETPMAPPAATLPSATAVPTTGETPAPPVVPAPPEAPSPGTAPAGTTATPAPPAAAAPTVPAAPAASAPQPAKPTQTAAAGAYRIQLAAVKSADAAKTAWTKIAKANPDALKGLSLTVVKVDRSDGALYRVQGGPLADRAAADAVCGRLKQTGQACMVVAP